MQVSVVFPHALRLSHGEGGRGGSGEVRGVSTVFPAGLCAALVWGHRDPGCSLVLSGPLSVGEMVPNSGGAGS